MGQGNVGDRLGFCHVQYPQVGLPLVEPIKRIVVGTEVLRHPGLLSNGAVEHPTESDTIDLSRMDAEPHDAARILIHDHQDPVGPQGGRLAPEQIHTPEAVFHVAQESQPVGTSGVLARPVVTGENPSNHVFVDLDVERQGDVLGDSRTAPVGITLLHFGYRMNKFCARALRAGLPKALRVRTGCGTFTCSRPCEGLAVSKASVQLRNGADELVASRVPSRRQEYGPTRRDWGIVAGSDSGAG